MTEDQAAAFLSHGSRTGKLSINLPSGRPTVTPIWFVLDDDGVLRMTTSGSSAKAKAVRADPRACLLVDLEEPPYAFVKVDATAAVVDDDSTLLRRVAAAVGGRYMGEDRAEEYGVRNGSEGQVVIEFTPTKITAVDDIAQ